MVSTGRWRLAKFGAVAVADNVDDNHYCDADYADVENNHEAEIDDDNIDNPNLVSTGEGARVDRKE